MDSHSKKKYQLSISFKKNLRCYRFRSVSKTKVMLPLLLRKGRLLLSTSAWLTYPWLLWLWLLLVALAVTLSVLNINETQFNRTTNCLHNTVFLKKLSTIFLKKLFSFFIMISVCIEPAVGLLCNCTKINKV